VANFLIDLQRLRPGQGDSRNLKTNGDAYSYGWSVYDQLTEDWRSGGDGARDWHALLVLGIRPR
jgi:hypothetical protein